jgi:hypothetical protein
VLKELTAGDVGFIVANIKRVADARMGDTVIEAARPAQALPGFRSDQADGVRRPVSGERAAITKCCATRSASSS